MRWEDRPTVGGVWTAQWIKGAALFFSIPELECKATSPLKVVLLLVPCTDELESKSVNQINPYLLKLLLSQYFITLARNKQTSKNYDTESLWLWSLLFQLDWLASRIPRILLSLPYSAGITTMGLSAAFMCMLRVWSQVAMLADNVPTELFPQSSIRFNSSSLIKTISSIFFAEFSLLIHFAIVLFS